MKELMSLRKGNKRRMKKIFCIATILFLVNFLCVAQTKEKQAFKFNIVKNDTIRLNDFSSQMELVSADKNIEILSFDMVFYIYDNTYKFSMNGSRLAESIVIGIKKLNPKPKRMIVENIVALNQNEGKERTYKGFTLFIK